MPSVALKANKQMYNERIFSLLKFKLLHSSLIMLLTLSIKKCDATIQIPADRYLLTGKDNFVYGETISSNREHVASVNFL